MPHPRAQQLRKRAAAGVLHHKVYGSWVEVHGMQAHLQGGRETGEAFGLRTDILPHLHTTQLLQRHTFASTQLPVIDCHPDKGTAGD